MKTLLIWIIIFSFLPGLPDHYSGLESFLGAVSLGMISMIKHGTIGSADLILWGMLLISHFGIYCLPFIYKKSYFIGVLIFVPLLFIVLYILLASVFIIFLLIPFIIMWIIALVNQIRQPGWW